MDTRKIFIGFSDAPNERGIDQEKFLIQAPVEKSRRKRWEAVLSWYLPPDKTAYIPEINIQKASLYPLAIIGEPFPEIGRYAMITGNRSIIQVNSLEQLASTLKEDASNVTIVADPKYLSIKELRNYIQKIGCSPTIITGKDRSSIIFMLAKQLLFMSKDPSTLFSKAILDEIGNFAVSEKYPDDKKYIAFNSTTINQMLLGDWHTLTLHAHGEGSHINLRGSVLCGLLDDHEQMCGRKIPGGCSAITNYCKRKRHEDTTVVLFHSIRSIQLILLSCNGFSVAGDLYPSNNSAVLSMVEGYVAQALCNDRPIGISVDQMHSYFVESAKINLKELAKILNDDYIENSIGKNREISVFPWIIVGDALLNITSYNLKESDTRPSFTHIENNYVSTPNDIVLPEALEKSSNRQPVKTTWLSIAEGTLRQAISFELLLDSILENLEDNNNFELWENLKISNCHLRQVCNRLRRVFTEINANRIDLLTINKISTTIEKINSKWSLMLATALTEDTEHRLEEIIPTLASKCQKVAQSDCDRCGSPVNSYYGETLLGSVPPLSWSSCPTCGFRDLLWGEQKKLQIRIPKQWDECNPLIINLSLESEDNGCQDHWIYATLRDKAVGKLIFKHPLTKGLPKSLSVPRHCGASPDLHTFKIWHVYAQSFSVHRRRVAYLA